MKSIFRIFFGAARTNPWLVLCCLLLAGLFEMVSIGALVPLIGHLGGGETQSSSQMNQLIEGLMGFLGLPNTFEAMIVLIVAAMVAKSVLSFGAHAYVSFTIARVVSVMRANLVRQLLNARWSYFADQRVGRIANAISNDATRAGTAYQRSAKFVAYFVQAGFYIIAALLISRELAMIGAVVGFILVVSLGWLVKIQPGGVVARGENCARQRLTQSYPATQIFERGFAVLRDQGRCLIGWQKAPHHPALQEADSEHRRLFREVEDLQRPPQLQASAAECSHGLQAPENTHCAVVASRLRDRVDVRARGHRGQARIAARRLPARDQDPRRVLEHLATLIAKEAFQIATRVTVLLREDTPGHRAPIARRLAESRQFGQTRLQPCRRDVRGDVGVSRHARMPRAANRAAR
ncbi:MAG: ABC transporter transmembrane domain-containing protein, partial [Pseudomonadota bacterium]